MPGPVSDSYNPFAVGRAAWREKLAQEGFRYFVLKAADVFDYLEDEQLEALDDILSTIEQKRQRFGKPASRGFWVFGRHWPKADVVRAFIEKVLGQRVGEPYRP